MAKTKRDKAFACRLRKLMDNGHISQQKLADYLGLRNRQSVAGYCNGRSAPDLDNIVKIAFFFGVSTDYLLGVSKQSNPQKRPICPKCRKLCETVYRTASEEIVGCDICLSKNDAWDTPACFPGKEQ